MSQNLPLMVPVSYIYNDFRFAHLANLSFKEYSEVLKKIWLSGHLLTGFKTLRCN